MATSAIGPGFLTQTAVFTQSLGASFGFVILASIVLDIGAQANIWRVIAVSEKRGQEIANLILPGLGYVIAALIVLGGLAFNIGNLAGTGLALNVLFGWRPAWGAVLSAAVAVGLFLLPEAGKAMDRFTQALGLLMIGITVWIAFTSSPPLGRAAVKSVAPDTIAWMPIVTLVGGTVGGYITFAGGHRLLDAGVKGPAALPRVTRSAVAGIAVVSVMRIVLFLAALGVVTAGPGLDPENPPASMFRQAAGALGYKLFGVVLWAAAVTSVVGSAYTSVSFVRSFSRVADRHGTALLAGFIAVSAAVFVAFGRPVKVLILAGALNGLILPVTLATILVAAYRKSVVGEYKHPLWMTLFGAAVVLTMSAMGAHTLVHELPRLFR
jgi:Mn2+/Fe2+ NRAMP family transporter